MEFLAKPITQAQMEADFRRVKTEGMKYNPLLPDEDGGPFFDPKMPCRHSTHYGNTFRAEDRICRRCGETEDHFWEMERAAYEAVYGVPFVKRMKQFLRCFQGKK